VALGADEHEPDPGMTGQPGDQPGPSTADGLQRHAAPEPREVDVGEVARGTDDDLGRRLPGGVRRPRAALRGSPVPRRQVDLSVGHAAPERRALAFSGGALVTPKDAVVGVNNSAFARDMAAALPVSVVDAVVDELLTRGHRRRPFIGVGVHPVALGAAAVRRYDLADEVALVVVSLSEGEPADTAGLQLGDLIVGVAGKPLARPSDLRDALATVADGASVDVTLLRGGAQQTVTVTPRDRGGQAA